MGIVEKSPPILAVLLCHPCPEMRFAPGFTPVVDAKEIPGVLSPLLCNTHASTRRRLPASPSMAAAGVSHAPRGAQGLRRADGIRLHRLRLRDDISTVKATYRLLRLARLLLIAQTAWPTGDATLPALLAQFLPNGCCAHWSWRAAPQGRGLHTVSMGGCRALAPSGGS
jgi:hypothetical protein